MNRRMLLKSVGAASALGLGVGVVQGKQGRGRGQGQGRGQLESPTVRGSVEQLAVTGAIPGATVRLLGRGQREIDTATADENGTVLFREVEPGKGYQVTQEYDGDESPRSNAVRVLPRDYTPPQGFYERQTLEPSAGYFEVRDETTLGYQVALPDADEWGEPPYPTVIDYSGYEPMESFWDSIDDEFNALGYAVVGVNKRGTGCSGWAFDYFEWLQRADGYDMVETIAAQDWTDGVGLVGKSYPGITQLHVAAMQPPSLDAIVPGHVVGDFYRDITYAGGMLNATYAVGWAQRQEAIAAFPSGFLWVNERADTEDEVCAENQRLRGHNQELLEGVLENETNTEFWRDRAPWNLVEDIEVPTLLVNSWQDETTGGRPALLLEQFADDVPVRFIGTNGDHGEYYGDVILEDIARFLSYYVKGEIPDADRASDDFDTALEAYESEDPIRVYWENGAAGHRVPAFHTDFSTWPPAETETLRYYLHPDGRLSTEPPDSFATTEYTYDPRDPAAQLGRYWDHPPEDEAAIFVTDPLEEDVTLLGSASADLWVASELAATELPDTDVEVTLVEVRPDGSEMYVQTGWLRASHRALDPAQSSERLPWRSYRAADRQPLEEGFNEFRVEIFPFGHLFREGSRIKLLVEAPGGNRPRWGFAAVPGPATNELAHGPEMASSIALPHVVDHEIETELPPPDLREQPIRPAVLPDSGE